MSTTLTGLPYTRFIRQVSAGPSAVIATAALAQINHLALQTRRWVQSDEIAGTMPPLNFTTNPPQDSFDGFKYASDYSAGKQNAYAGMVAYRFQTPADAQSGGGHESDLTSIAVSLYVDRWLVGGVRVAAYASDDDSPSEDWTTLREGEIYDDAVLPATDPRADQNTTVALTFAGSTAALAYIWVILSLEDYQSVSPLDVRRLEGGALIVGQTNSTVFVEDAVAADIPPAVDIVHFVESQSLILNDEIYSRGYKWTKNSNTIPFPRAWSRMLSYICISPAGVVQTSIVDRASLYRDGTDINVYGATHVFTGSTGSPKAFRALRFENACPKPSAGVVLYLAMYMIQGNKIGPDGNYLPDRCAGTRPVNKVSMDNIHFWRGREPVLYFGAGSAPDFAASENISLVLSTEIKDGFLSTREWPISISIDDFFEIVLAVSPCRITQDPGSADTTHYGIQWSPGRLEFLT